jgi:hypothetical protein
VSPPAAPERRETRTTTPQPAQRPYSGVRDTKETRPVTTETAIDFRTVPPKLTATPIGWQAWWEDNDLWDGNVLYTDLDAAKHHAAVDYIGEKHDWFPSDDPANEAPNATLTWAFEHHRWHLLADGKNTGVQLYELSIYTPAA